ncbi:unnamed protein product [Camellia sinensis]
MLSLSLCVPSRFQLLKEEKMKPLFSSAATKVGVVLMVVMVTSVVAKGGGGGGGGRGGGMQPWGGEIGGVWPNHHHSSASSFRPYMILRLGLKESPTTITALSFVCWIWKDSVTAQQIGPGLRGLGIGSFALDWSTVAGFLGSPLATPAFAILNILVGYIAIVYVVIPVAYSSNWFEAKRFPIFSAHVFNADGGLYDVSKVLNETTFAFNRQGYESYSKIHLSIFFAFTYALSFATLAATLSHVALFHGRSQQSGLNVVTELIMGFMYPGKPLANVTFKTYGYISMTQAIMFLSDFRLGHCMKTPPKSMFVVQ